jgi:hypothetical protein
VTILKDYLIWLYELKALGLDVSHVFYGKLYYEFYAKRDKKET